MTTTTQLVAIVSALEAKMDKAIATFDGHVVRCDLSNERKEAATRELAEVVTGLAGKLRTIEELPMKAIRWIGGLIVAAAVSLLVQNFYLHAETSRKQDQAVTQASHAADEATNTAMAVKSISKAISATP